MTWLLFAMATTLAADVRGMTVSCPTWGWEWGSDDMVRTLDVLGSDGVNWVSIHPYARISGDGSVSARPMDPSAPPEWLARPIREAHARGMKVMIKPHLAYWGSPFSWRGEIRFDDADARARFFADYRSWIVDIARAVPEADALVVATELEGTARYEAEWRSIIGAVRGVYGGPLTWGANWDCLDQVKFWDALDVIGVQAYFPIVPGSDGAPVPTPQQLDAGWDRVLADLRALHEATGKHIVFTELGYDASPQAASRPWESGSGGDEVQRACLAAALRAVDREPAVVGAFLWKWFPGEVQRGDFRMSSPEVRQVIRESWLAP